MADANAQMREGWAVGAAGWVANERVVDHAFAPVTAALLRAAALAPGQRVLDVGCGSGTLLAAAVAAGADAVGVDIAPPMVEAARARVPSAQVRVGDAQTDDLLDGGAAFDLVLSRFGVMFFDDPTAAFTNLRGAASRGGRLVVAIWRGPDENPAFSLGTGPLRALVDLPVVEPEAPGPTALADPGRTRSILERAGWDAVEISPLDVTLDYGLDGTDGVEARLAMTLAGGIARTAMARLTLDAQQRADLLEQMREEIRGAIVDGVVRLPGACWLVTAGA